MPTDADWGRLYKYNTSGDAGLVMPFRSYYFRDFFAGGWQELMVGMIYRASGNSGDSSSMVAERQSEIADANLFHFGVSQSSNGAIDVANNQNFLGIRGQLGTVSQITISPDKQLAYLRLAYTKKGATSYGGTTQVIPLKDGIVANPFSMIGLRFILNPLDKQMYIKYAFQEDVTLADDAANTTTLNTFLQGITRTIADMDAGFPVDNVADLKSFFVYWPYLYNRLMLQCVGALKYA